MKLDLSNIPEHMHAGIQGYVDHGWRPGSFFYAVLRNNLVDAASNADDKNIKHLADYASLLYNEIPGAAWGDSDAVDRWVKAGGMDQYNKEQ